MDPMPPSDRLPGDATLDALLRMLVRRLPGRSAAIYALDGGSAWLRAATAQYLSRCATPAALALADHAIADVADASGLPKGAGDVLAVDRAVLQLRDGFPAACPACSDSGRILGWVVLVDVRRRPLSPAVVAVLRDCAQVLGGILAPANPIAGDRPAPAPEPDRDAGSERADEQATQTWIAEMLARRSEASTSAFLLIDLDRFHALNEVLGSATGDQVLDRTRSRIRDVLGPGECLLRLAGDRFGIVAERAGSDPRSLADRLLRTIARPMDFGGRRISVQASIGIVDQLTAEAASATVLTQAVAALRRAKHDGRNRYALHVPAIETIDQERSHLEFDLAHALPEGQMHVVFQPYLSLETGEITGAEALLRWRHPTRGDIRPTSFVPLAEATGLILPLGAWTLRTALALAARWPEGLALSVNISALQFHQPHFVEEIDAALARSGFPAERLELEITETVLMRDNAQTVSQLEALIERGIRIALDDFGTGYSALAYLARLPHHRIKLDRSFVQDLANPATAELIRAIIASARGQGVAITAEGIETPAQLEAVRAFGFTHAQGFATGAPIADPTEAFGRVPA